MWHLRRERGSWGIKLQPQGARREEASRQETGFFQTFVLHNGFGTCNN